MLNCEYWKREGSADFLTENEQQKKKPYITWTNFTQKTWIWKTT